MYSSLGQGIPNQCAQTSRAARFNPVLAPTHNEAVSDFQQTGGRLHLISEFGRDPLDGRRDLQQFRQDTFTDHFPSFDTIYHQVVNIMTAFFSNSLYYISLTSHKDLQALSVQTSSKLYVLCVSHQFQILECQLQAHCITTT